MFLSNYIRDFKSKCFIFWNWRENSTIILWSGLWPSCMSWIDCIDMAWDNFATQCKNHIGPAVKWLLQFMLVQNTPQFRSIKVRTIDLNDSFATVGHSRWMIIFKDLTETRLAWWSVTIHYPIIALFQLRELLSGYIWIKLVLVDSSGRKRRHGFVVVLL